MNRQKKKQEKTTKKRKVMDRQMKIRVFVFDLTWLRDPRRDLLLKIILIGQNFERKWTNKKIKRYFYELYLGFIISFKTSENKSTLIKLIKTNQTESILKKKMVPQHFSKSSMNLAHGPVVSGDRQL